MYVYLSQFVLGQRNSDSEVIIQILIIALFVVAGTIKSLFAAKQEQNKKQNQKKPVSQSNIPSKPPLSSEKIKMQRERVEQFLEGILQPKQSHNRPSSTRTAPSKPQANGPVLVPAKTSPPVTKIYTNQSDTSEAYREMSESVRQAETDTILDKRAIKLDTQIEQIPQLKEEHIQEDQHHLISHNLPKKRGTVTYRKTTEDIYTIEDSDDLRKAIIFTEILGKPLSLRESEALYD